MVCIYSGHSYWSQTIFREDKGIPRGFSNISTLRHLDLGRDKFEYTSIGRGDFMIVYQKAAPSEQNPLQLAQL